MELQIFANLIEMFGGNPAFFGLFALAVGFVIIVLLRLPFQATVPLMLMLGLMVGTIVVGLPTILFLFVGLMIAFLVTRVTRGG